MKQKLIESNKYKRYSFYVLLYGGLYLLIVFIFLVVAVIGSLEKEPVINPWKIFLIGAIPFSLVLLPFIFFYGIKLLSFRINADKYISATAIITSIETSEFLRTDHRDVVIKSDIVDRLIYAKVYKGTLYDEVAKGKKIEIAYNEQSEDVVIIKVI